MTGTQAASRAGVPPAGTTMAQVEQRYGAPAARLAAVGQPPITRWVYPSFVVFFEGNIVIHAVASSAAQPSRLSPDRHPATSVGLLSLRSPRRKPRTRCSRTNLTIRPYPIVL